MCFFLMGIVCLFGTRARNVKKQKKTSTGAWDIVLLPRVDSSLLSLISPHFFFSFVPFTVGEHEGGGGSSRNNTQPMTMKRVSRQPTRHTYHYLYILVVCQYVLLGPTLVTAFITSAVGDPRGGRKRTANFVSSSLSSTRRDHHDVIIVGGGLIGTATAAALYTRGIRDVCVYERQELRQRRVVGAAIGLYPNGLTALNYIDPTIHSTVMDTAIPMRFFERRDLQDQLVQITDVQTIRAVSPVLFPWFRLQELFRKAIPKANVQYGTSFVSFQNCVSELHHDDVEEEDLITVTLRKEGSDPTTFNKTCRVLIGADGIRSTIRAQMLGDVHLQHHGKIMYRAIVDKRSVLQQLQCNNSTASLPPPGTQVSYQGREQGKSFSFRETTHNTITITAAVPVSSANGTIITATHPATASENKLSRDCRDTNAANIDSASLRHERFQDHFTDHPRIVQYLLHSIPSSAIHEDLVRNVSVAPEWSQGNVVILGDAAHAMTPHMGQGANMGLEDVCELVHRLVPVLSSRRLSLGPITKPISSSSPSPPHTFPGVASASITSSQALEAFWQCRINRVREVHERSSLNSAQSNTFHEKSASVPFQRREYSESFQEQLYHWNSPVEEWMGSSSNELSGMAKDRFLDGSSD